MTDHDRRWPTMEERLSVATVHQNHGEITHLWKQERYGWLWRRNSSPKGTWSDPSNSLSDKRARKWKRVIGTVELHVQRTFYIFDAPFSFGDNFCALTKDDSLEFHKTRNKSQSFCWQHHNTTRILKYLRRWFFKASLLRSMCVYMRNNRVEKVALFDMFSTFLICHKTRLKYIQQFFSFFYLHDEYHVLSLGFYFNTNKNIIIRLSETLNFI